MKESMAKMGTNFYLFTQDAEAKEKYFFGDYELTEFPSLGYLVHIAKTSYGWLPLFQMSEGIKSTQDIERISKDENIFIVDEYGEQYGWDEFKERVLNFNGGIKGKVEPELVDDKYIPISHFDYKDKINAHRYYLDGDGYEFTAEKFS
jgi:hypothetical protein